MDDILQLTLLYDFYGELLTEKQKQVYELHYQNDLSLTEIGEELSISRQAVRDQLKRTEKILLDYEEKLQLVSRFQAQKKAVQEMKHIMEGLEKKNPFMLHAKVGAVLAEKKYDITDEEVLGAIRWHTTGRPDMTLLEKIVYVADYIEPKRDKAPNLGEIRKLAFIDLDRALLKILQDTLNYLGDSPEDVDSMTKSTYDFYQQQLQP